MFVFRSDRLPGELLFTASSLESNEAFWHLPPHHPANTSTALLQPAPFIVFHSLLLRHTLTNTHTQSQTNTCIHRQRVKLVVLHRQQTISAAHVPHYCFCICSLFGVLFGRITALSLNKEKKSYARKTGLHLVLFLLFFVVFF